MCSHSAGFGGDALAGRLVLVDFSGVYLRLFRAGFGSDPKLSTGYE